MVKYPCHIRLQRKVNLCQIRGVYDMFNSRLTTMEYRAVARSMDRHRRQFSIRPFNAYLSGTLCRNFRLLFVVTPAFFLASISYSFSSSFSLHSYWTRLVGLG